MRRTIRYCVLGLLAIAIGCRLSESSNVIYSVDVYDPQRNPIADLTATIAMAKAADKRILLQVGGDWCAWCHKLDQFIPSQPAVASAIGANFIVMKVNYSDENKNELFLSQYPPAPAYPHWYVLDADGKFLHSQPTADFEANKTYSQPAILLFVDTWKG